MRSLKRISMRLAVVAFVGVTPSGCAGVGMETLSDVLGGGGLYQDEISGEVQQIDTRRQEIDIASGWSGVERLRYDGRTTVVAGQRRYDIRDLRRGDRVRVVVDDAGNRRGELYARRIELERSAVRDQPRHEDTRKRRSLVRLDGNVVSVDTRSGAFALQERRGEVIRVNISNETSREARDRARGLRRGQRVRIEAQLTDDDRARLLRFL